MTQFADGQRVRIAHPHAAHHALKDRTGTVVGRRYIDEQAWIETDLPLPAEVADRQPAKAARHHQVLLAPEECEEE